MLLILIGLMVLLAFSERTLVVKVPLLMLLFILCLILLLKTSGRTSMSLTRIEIVDEEDLQLKPTMRHTPLSVSLQSIQSV